MPRRASDWIDSLVNFAVGSGGQAHVSLMTGVAPVNVRRQTLVRTILRISFSSVTVAGSWGTQIADIGIGITSQEAFAAGVLADPITPGDQPSRGWIYRNRVVPYQNGDAGPLVTTLQADIRAGRKLDDGECFLVVNNSPLLGTTFTIQVTGIIRQLWLLP